MRTIICSKWFVPYSPFSFLSQICCSHGLNHIFLLHERTRPKKPTHHLYSQREFLSLLRNAVRPIELLADTERRPLVRLGILYGTLIQHNIHHCCWFEADSIDIRVRANNGFPEKAEQSLYPSVGRYAHTSMCNYTENSRTCRILTPEAFKLPCLLPLVSPPQTVLKRGTVPACLCCTEYLTFVLGRNNSTAEDQDPC